jgi:hypothetical protein
MFRHIDPHNSEFITDKVYSGKTAEIAAKKIWREHKELSVIYLTNENGEILKFHSSDWSKNGNSKKFKK